MDGCGNPPSVAILDISESKPAGRDSNQATTGAVFWCDELRLKLTEKNRFTMDMEAKVDIPGTCTRQVR